MCKYKLLILILVVAILVTGVTVVYAQTGGGFDLSWWTVDGGGGTVTDGNYTLIGTAGQPEAGATLTGGGFTLKSGFWPARGGIPSSGYLIILPIITK